MALVLALGACGDDDSGPTTADDVGDDPARLQVAASEDGLAYDPDTLEFEAGQAFSIRFNNPTERTHSFVLVREGDEEAVLNAATIAAGDPTGAAGAIVGVAPIGNQEFRLLVVEPQSEGTYTYFCTVDDHYQEGMRGTLEVG